MRAFVTADWHLGVNNYGITTDDGVNSRLQDAEDIIMRMIDWCCNNQVDLFVMAGDIFHTNRPGQHEQLVFLRILERLKECEMYSRFIIGNHDYNSKLGAPHALKLFQEMLKGNEKVKIYSETAWEIFQPHTEPLMVCFYPFKGTPPDWAEIGRYGAVSATALVCHSHLAGAVVGAEPFEIRDDAATNVGNLPVDHVWAGHFHKPQKLCDKPKAFYPGSPYAVDFNERCDTKGAMLVDVFARTFKTVGFESRRLYQIDIDSFDSLVEFMRSDWPDATDTIVKTNVELQEKDAQAFNEGAIREKLIEVGVHSIASINLKVHRELAKRDPEIKLDTDLKDNYAKFVGGKDYGNHTDAVRVKGLEIIQKCAS